MALRAKAPFDLEGLCRVVVMASLCKAASNPIILGPFLRFLGLLSERMVCLGRLHGAGADRWFNGICAVAITSRCCRPSRGGPVLPVGGGGAPALAAGRIAQGAASGLLRRGSLEELRLALAALASRWWCATGFGVEVRSGAAVMFGVAGLWSPEETATAGPTRATGSGPVGRKTTASPGARPAVWCFPRSTQPQRWARRWEARMLSRSQAAPMLCSRWLGREPAPSPPQAETRPAVDPCPGPEAAEGKEGRPCCRAF